MLQMDILKCMRGNKSQTWMSRRLGHSYNKYSKWEAGTLGLPWTEFNKIAKILRVDLGEPLKKYLLFHGPCHKYDVFIEHLIGEMKTAEVAALTGVSRFTVRRWVHRECCPATTEVLALIDRLTPRLPEVIAEWVEIEKIPSLRDKWNKREAERTIYYESPWAAAVIRCLELSQYSEQNEPKSDFIAKYIGISKEQEKATISALKKIKAIRRKGGRWYANENRLYTNVDKLGFNRLRLYWLNRIVNHLEKTPGGTKGAIAGQTIFSISDKGFEKIRVLFHEFYKNVRMVIEEDKGPPSIVGILSSQLFDLKTLRPDE